MGVRKTRDHKGNKNTGQEGETATFLGSQRTEVCTLSHPEYGPQNLENGCRKRLKREHPAKRKEILTFSAIQIDLENMSSEKSQT